MIHIDIVTRIQVAKLDWLKYYTQILFEEKDSVLFLISVTHKRQTSGSNFNIII